jgi:hypothetical protein
MRPRNWWQEENARHSARRGVAVFVVLLVALAVLIAIAQGYFGV